MRKQVGVLVIAVLCVLLAGCGQKPADGGAAGGGAENAPSGVQVDGPVEEASQAADTEGPFVYRLVSEKESYAAGEKVQLYAELEYIGEEESVEIYHSASPFYFPMRETTRDYDIGYMMNQPLVSTTLKKGEPLREYYQHGGGFTEHDSKEYVEFIKKFGEEGFQTGRYEVNGWAEFYVTEGGAEGEKTDYKLTANIVFEVQ